MKKIITFILSCLIAFTAVGCGNSTNEENKKEKVLTIGAGRTFCYGSTKVDYMHKTTNVWESLFTLDKNMNPIPDLGEEITQSEDGLTWKIKLKQGVKFHDGKELTAEVAKANLLRVYHFSSKEKKCVDTQKNTVELGDIKEITIEDKYTLSVIHNKIVPNFDEKLAYSDGMMFSLDSFNKDGQIIKPIGTGPVKFEEYDDKTQILTLSKFEDYRDGAMNIDKVIFKSIPDADTRLAALRSGDIDVIADVGSILPSQAKLIKGDENLVLKEQPVATNHYLLMNMNKGKLFNDKEMRLALNLLLDRNLIVNNILEGYGEVADSVVTNNATEFCEKVKYDHNKEEAKKLIGNKLKGKKEKLKIILNSGLVGRWPYKDVMVILQEELKKVGIEAEIEILDSPTWQERMKKGEYDLTISPYTCDTAEPLAFFDAHMKSNGGINVSRSYGYKNSRVDELIEKVSTEKKLEKRIEYYKELQKIAKDECPIIPIWHDKALYAMNKKVENFELDLNFWPDLHKVIINE